jgi:hypothetical protein
MAPAGSEFERRSEAEFECLLILVTRTLVTRTLVTRISLRDPLEFCPRQAIAARSCDAVIPCSLAIALACWKPTCATYERTISHVISWARAGAVNAKVLSINGAMIVSFLIVMCSRPHRPKDLKASRRQAAGTKTYYDACPVTEHDYVIKLNILPAIKILAKRPRVTISASVFWRLFHRLLARHPQSLRRHLGRLEADGVPFSEWNCGFV